MAYAFDYSKSLRFGLRDGSLDKKPKINKDVKKITVAYTTQEVCDVLQAVQYIL